MTSSMNSQFRTLKGFSKLIVLSSIVILFNFFHFYASRSHADNFTSSSTSQKYLNSSEWSWSYSIPESSIAIAVITSPETFERAIVMHNTWKKRTSAKVQFFMGKPQFENMSVNALLENAQNQYHPFFPARKLSLPKVDKDVITLPVIEDQNHKITRKTFAALKWLYQHDPSKSWYFKCDDDTFVIPTNLAYHLRNYNPNDHLYMGRVIFGMMASGGSGYVISRNLMELVSKFGESYLDQAESDKGEDVMMALFLEENLNVTVINLEHLMIRLPEDYLGWKGWDIGFDGYSVLPATFHNAIGLKAFEVDYFLYEMHLVNAARPH